VPDHSHQQDEHHLPLILTAAPSYEKSGLRPESGGLAFEVEQGVMPFCWSERALARVSTVQHYAGNRQTSFLADFLGNCAVAFPICPLMLQKCAFRYFGPTPLGVVARSLKSTKF
jgi:hypothetical protein